MSSKQKDRARAAALDAVYAKLPALRCKGLCSIACGPIPMTVIEADRLRATAHVKPRAGGPLGGVRCVYLTPENRCGAYRVRPLICRVWGVVKRMSCMHGCVPDRWITDAEFVALAQEVERIGGSHVITCDDGLMPTDWSFADLDVTTREPADVDGEAEYVRTLRALFGGTVIGVSRHLPGGAYNVDDPDDMRRLQQRQIARALDAVDGGEDR